jgi:two-component system cell cycle sensor histidine kinase/response regulator CckA
MYRYIGSNGREGSSTLIVSPHPNQPRPVADHAAAPVSSEEHPEAKAALRHGRDRLRQTQKMEAIGRLASGVAHDFNNMLAVINGYAELLLGRDDLDESMQSALQEMRKAGERAEALIRQLMAFSRKQVVSPQVLDLNQVLGNIESMLRRLIGEDLDLVVLPDPALGHIKADPAQIEQILVNLVVNARDAMPNGGKLTIETANIELDQRYAHQHPGVRVGPYVMLAVSDTGCGMTSETMSHLFEPFFTTKGDGKGTGLGLATTYGIVRQSHGHIWVYSEPDHGSTFKIYLPRVHADVAPSERAGARVTAASGTETILLVEDEQQVRKMVRELLQVSGFTVIEAARVGEALILCQSHPEPIHLLLTDVVMPGMNGRELAEHLTRMRPEMKVLFMSGYTDEAVVRHGVLAVGSAFLQKPFTPDSLTSKVRQTLDGVAEAMEQEPNHLNG